LISLQKETEAKINIQREKEELLANLQKEREENQKKTTTISTLKSRSQQMSTRLMEHTRNRTITAAVSEDKSSELSAALSELKMKYESEVQKFVTASIQDGIHRSVAEERRKELEVLRKKPQNKEPHQPPAHDDLRKLKVITDLLELSSFTEEEKKVLSVEKSSQEAQRVQRQKSANSRLVTKAPTTANAKKPAVYVAKTTRTTFVEKTTLG
jgi:hypothetical protein